MTASITNCHSCAMNEAEILWKKKNENVNP